MKPLRHPFPPLRFTFERRLLHHEAPSTSFPSSYPQEPLSTSFLSSYPQEPFSRSFLSSYPQEPFTRSFPSSNPQNIPFATFFLLETSRTSFVDLFFSPRTGTLSPFPIYNSPTFHFLICSSIPDRGGKMQGRKDPFPVFWRCPAFFSLK
jgi:hypothetical protein